MHRLPKIFSRNKTVRPDFSSTSCPTPKRLDRCNAVKNFNYEFSPSSSASFSSSSCTTDESLQTRSLDLHDGKTSFRVDGTEGELEIICRTLGFSGIDDFSINPEEYEAMKVGSSPILDVFKRFEPVDDHRPPEVDSDGTLEKPIESCDVLVGVSEAISDLAGRNLEGNFVFSYKDRIRDSVVVVASVGEPSKITGDGVNVGFRDIASGRSRPSRGNGIKGVRPPVLATPPLIALGVVDKESSTWDSSRGCALDNNADVLRIRTGLSEDEDIDEAGIKESGRNMSEENCSLTWSRSFTTSFTDDDSSSTTPQAGISPHGKLRVAIENWQKGELIGRGSFGSVYEGFSDCGLIFAVKEVSLLDQGDEGKQRIIQLQQEIALLSQFEHKNIVRYYGTKKDASHLYIFLELVPKGSLLSLYRKYSLRVQQVSNYTRQILHGLKYLHDRNVVHRDIKCANILVETNRSVKLADFGLAKAIKLNDVQSCKGTAFWMAPEVVRSQGYGLAADIWSLGCTVLEMFTRSFPYNNLECMAALFKIGKGERPSIPNSLSGDARDFILQCLQVNPSLRPTAAQLLDHPFVKMPLPASHSFGKQI